MGAAQARSEVVVDDRNTDLHVAQRARVTVLFEGRSLGGAKLEVRKVGSGDSVAALTADSNGQIILPELPGGMYQIAAWSSQDHSHAAWLPVIICDCPDLQAVIDWSFDSLNGDAKPIDPPKPISEFWIEVSSVQFPQLRQLIAEAEPRILKELRGTVADLTGERVREAWVRVVRRGSRGDEKVAMVRTDSSGAFAAELPEGHYVVLVSALGFQTQAISITIQPSGDASSLQIVLKVGAAS